MHQPLRAAFLEEAGQVIDTGSFILGPRVQAFEEDFARYCDTQYAVGVGNGLEALHIALRVLGVGPGDEVVVPANTYIATVLAVMYTGATPVLAEPRDTTANLDPAALEAAITPRTRAIIPVHLYGQPCEMEAILAIAEKHGLHIIEDNAQAQGARWQGRRTGSFGHLNATSFYPGKNIGALGDGGALTTADPDLARAARMWRNYGSEVKYYNEVAGYNSRLDEMQAAFLRIKLRHLDAWNSRRVELAGRYHQALQDLAELSLPGIAQGADPVYHLYVLRTERRDALQAYLQDRGIGTLIHYPVPPHLQTACRDLGWKAGQFPISEAMARTALSLPMYPGLTDAEADEVAETVRSFFQP